MTDERDDIEAMLRQRDPGSRAAPPHQSSGRVPTSPAEELLRQAEADLAAVADPDFARDSNEPFAAAGAAPFQFQPFDDGGAEDRKQFGRTAPEDAELDLRIELGRAELLIDEVLKLKEGSVVPLDKLAGDPVDVLVNGRLIARGEVLVLNENFCIRVAEILTPEL